MKVSVLISSKNRSKFLATLLGSFSRLKCDNFDWELIIVDNGSTDETMQVLKKERDKYRFPLTVMQEPRPGKSRSLNLALTEAKGDLVVFTDDDIAPAESWLEAYVKAAEERPNCAGFIGKILPIWDSDIPEWLYKDGEYTVPRGIIGLCDFGEKERQLEGVLPSGVNVAIRREWIESLGKFREDLGPGTALPYAEDTEYLRRLVERGYVYFYVPRALVYHFNPVERITKSYVLHWIYDAARCQVIAYKALKAVPTINGIPRYLLRQFIQRLISWLAHIGRESGFHRKMRMINTLGEIAGYQTLKRLNR